MMAMHRAALLALALVLSPLPVSAIGPEELLDDPALEARARSITKELRCVVCQSESIDDSNAEIARDLRLLVRERIMAGDTDEEVFAFVTDRYGEFVLFHPPMTLANAPLWFAGPVFLIFGVALVTAIQRRRAREAAAPRRDLTPEEQARIDALLKE
jgi:cytochrome c-type biogenesis protein CcmH